MLFRRYPLYNSTYFKIKISSYRLTNFLSIVFILKCNKSISNEHIISVWKINHWLNLSNINFTLWACGIQIHMHRKVHFVTKFKVIHWGFRTFFSILIQLFSHIESFQTNRLFFVGYCSASNISCIFSNYKKTSQYFHWQ